MIRWIRAHTNPDANPAAVTDQQIMAAVSAVLETQSSV